MFASAAQQQQRKNSSVFLNDHITSGDVFDGNANVYMFSI